MKLNNRIAIRVTAVIALILIALAVLVISWPDSVADKSRDRLMALKKLEEKMVASGVSKKQKVEAGADETLPPTRQRVEAVRVLPKDQEDASSGLGGSIVGKDNRERTYNHPSELGRSTGLILAKNHDDDRHSYGCTGTILSEQFVLTVANCVIDPNNRKARKDIYFIPRTLYKNQMTYGRFPAIEIYFPKGFLSHGTGTAQSLARDIALVKFRDNAKGENLMEKTGGKIGFWGQDEFDSDTATTIGYAVIQEDWTPYRQEDCQVKKLNQYLSLTSCDFSIGQSGSAIAIHSEKYNKSYIHGVMSGSNKASKANFVTRITPSRQKMIMSIATGEYQSVPESDEEEWMGLPSDISRGVNVLVENDCRNRRTLYGMLNYRDRSGRELHNLSVIKPGHTVNLGLVPDLRYKIGIRIDNGNQASFTSRKPVVRVDYGGEGKFDLYEYGVNNSGDGLYVIDECY